jgi:hypothetical protein
MNGTDITMNDTRTVKLVCECEYITVDRKTWLDQGNDGQTPLKANKPGMSYLAAAAADDDDDTKFSYVTDSSVASTIHSSLLYIS